MELVRFIADSAADAARQVRERLGPDAVVVQVRAVDSGTRGWFGKKTGPRLEVLAYRPEPGTAKELPDDNSGRLDVVAGDAPDPRPTFPFPSPAPPATSISTSTSASAPASVPSFIPGPSSARGREPVLDSREKQEDGRDSVTSAGRGEEPESLRARSGGGSWRAGALLEASGLLPQEAQRVVDRLRREHGDTPPSAMADELILVKRALRSGWKDARPTAVEGGEIHVLVGAAGVGKTTCLSKWLTQVALGEGRPVRVWRLDGQTANTADALAVYCDVLGVPLARVWGEGDGVGTGEVGFVDLPGTDWRDAGAVTRLGEMLRGMGRVRIHLVLNGAYETSLMLRQVRAFGVLAIEDLVITHLDEEGRWGKLWNLVGGTNYSVRFLSAGQNVPGDFQVATPEALWSRQFRG